MTTQEKRPYIKGGADCTAIGCTRKAKGRGLCPSHYARAKRGAVVDGAIRPPGPESCTANDCGKPVHGGGLCQGHYWQKRQGRVLTPLRERFSPIGECLVDTCEREAANTGLCSRHYERKREGRTDWDDAVRPKASDGEGHLNKHGYRIVRSPRTGRLTGQHIVRAEELLGRPLLREEGQWRATENVHHKDGNRDNNVTDGPFVMDDRGRLLSGNLEVWSTSQPAGQEIGPKLDWAVSLLETYAEYLPVSHLPALAAILDKATDAQAAVVEQATEAS